MTLSGANNIYLNADITASLGGLTLNAGNNIASGNEGLSGSIQSNVTVDSFTLQNGSWVQNANDGSLPTFMASNDFELQNSSSFLRRWVATEKQLYDRLSRRRRLWCFTT